MSTRTPKLLAALWTAAMLSLLTATTATAEPIFDLGMTRTHQPTKIGDERLAYELTVANEAESEPGVGTTLTCRGTPEDGASWSGNPHPTFTYQWLREGTTEIPGATAKTYTTTVDDAGKSIQCMITGTNDPEGVLPGSYDPVASSVVSLPPTTVAPAPPSAPPSGTSRPSLGGPSIASTPSGTASTTEGSKLLTDVVTAAGTGTFTSGSPVVEGVTMSLASRFEADQAVDGSCVAAEATIPKVEETAAGVFKVTLSKPATCGGSGTLEAGALPFGIGQEISGECIPAGAKVLKATAQGLGFTVRHIEVDKEATCSKTEMTIEATSTLVCSPPSGWSAGTPIEWSFQWLRNGEEIAGATSAEYEAQEADTEPHSMLQCRATAEDEEGQRTVVISERKPTRPEVPVPYRSPGTSTNPTVDFETQTSGEVSLKLEAPAGEGISIFRARGPGWQCEKTPFASPPPATVTCTRSDPLGPQDSYEPLEVVIALGQNPPATLLTKAEVFGGGALAPATVKDEYTIPEAAIPFGFKAFEIEVLDEEGNDYAQAGGHSFSAGARIEFNTHERPEPLNSGTWPDAVNGSPREVRTQAPPGFVGNPRAVSELCVLSGGSAEDCPQESAVGELFLSSTAASNPTPTAIYAIEPERGQPAQFAFQIAEFLVTLNPELRPGDGYAIDLVTQPLPKVPEVFATEATLCSHGVIFNGPEVEGCREADDPEALDVPFLTNPTHCEAGKGPITRILADSWEGHFDEASFESPELKDCDKVPFNPDITFKPTSKRADSPTGMDVTLTLPTTGLEDPDAIAEAHLEGTTVTLPEGMAVNPASAAGQGACTLEQLGMSASGVPDDAPVSCPESSKLGTVEANTPILEDTLGGTVYLAKQGSNPFGSLLALYLVIDSPENGILIKLAGKVSPDPNTGRLTVSFENNPQAPLSSVRLHFPGGNRAALINPPSCGTHTVHSQLTPWSAADPANPSEAETLELSSSFALTQGPDGGACPTGALEPKLRAWLANPQAGATTPFSLDLSRNDGTQRFRGVSAKTPPGLSAYLKGIPCCPVSTLTSAPTAPGSGAALLAAPVCPPASQVGSVSAGAGAGPDLLFIETGKAYLSCPYKGAPLSLGIATPAVSGPFDLGNVVVMSALHLDPQSAQITAVSDPIPTILHGIPLDLRDVRVNLDRPNFTLAPTNCEPLATTATVTGDKGATATVSDRFQVGGCEKLGFKPKLALRLHGKTRRGAYQRLEATLTARAGDANIKRASVALPHSIFLAQEHIRTVCTRVQFAADQCPQGSIYGKAKAISPLLDYPLQGLVYLRSSSNPLPDMVVALRGPAHQPLEIDLVGRIDSKNGGIRNTFDLVPDAPVSKFTLQLRGGKKSLLVNSRELCKGTQRASVKLDAQNGRERSFRPVVQNGCGGKGKSKGKDRERR